MKLVLKIFVFIFSLLFCMAAIGLGGITLWAATGPRDLSKYNSFIENSINSVMESGKVVIGNSSLSWEGADELLVITANNVIIKDNDGAVSTKLSKIYFQYDILSLFSGNLIPSSLTLFSPELRLDGIFSSGSDKNFDIGDIDTSKVDKIRIVDGKLVLLQERQVWKIKTATANFKNNKAVINANLSPSENEVVGLSGEASFEDGSYSLVATITDFSTDNLKRYMPQLEKVSLTLNGAVGITGNSASMAPDKVEFELASFSGTVTDDENLRDVLILKNGQAKGSYSHKTQGLNIQWLGLEFEDGTKIGAQGSAFKFMDFKISAAIESIKPENIYKYWPKNMADNAVTWVKANLSGGQIREVTAKIDLNTEDINNALVDVRFKFFGLNVSYHDGLIPVSGVDGVGILGAKSVKFIIDSGVVGESKISNTEIVLDGFNSAVQKFSLNGTMKGNASDLANYYIKLGTGRKIVEDARNISGIADSKLSLSFPLLADLLMKDIKIELDARIKAAQVSGAYGVADLSEVGLDLKLKNDDYALKGTGIAVITKPSENIKFGRTPTVFDVQNDSGELSISTAMDLSSSEVTIPALGIHKPMGDGAKLLFKSVQTQGSPIIKSLDFKSDALNLSAIGELTPAYDDVSSLIFSQLEFGKTEVIGKITTTPYVTAEFKGDVINIEPILKHLSESEDDGKNSSFIARFSTSKMLMAGDEFYRDAYLGVSCNADVCGNLEFTSGDTKIDLNPTTLAINTNDAGKFLRAFDIYENMKGGKLVVTGNVSGNNYDGEIKVTDFNILKAKTLAKMLTLGSLSGIADALSGNGISFKKLSSKFKMSKDQLEIEDYRMVGNAIGITSSGTINRKTDIADLSGNIIPAYTANTLLGKIPLLGDVLIGNDGVFALAYSMKGKTEDPEVRVNPLSVLAPGFLKKVFE